MTHQHDKGTHATFAQLSSLTDAKLLPMFPAGTVTADNLSALKWQVEQVHQVALKYPTADAARAGGYFKVTVDVEGMGEHWINFQNMTDGAFDPAKPEGLLFSKIDDGEPKLVGVWFLEWPGTAGSTKEAPPAGFAGDLDLWHGHLSICLGGTTAAENASEAACKAKGGNFIADARWMMHVWVAPGSENPDGFFAYINRDLAAKQKAPVPLLEGDS